MSLKQFLQAGTENFPSVLLRVFLCGVTVAETVLAAWLQLETLKTLISVLWKDRVKHPAGLISVLLLENNWFQLVKIHRSLWRDEEDSEKHVKQRCIICYISLISVWETTFLFQHVWPQTLIFIVSVSVLTPTQMPGWMPGRHLRAAVCPQVWLSERGQVLPHQRGLSVQRGL